MKAGDKNRIQCNECDVESEVIFEPKAVGLSTAELEEKGLNETNDINSCPFCGSDQFEVLE